jgi:predicted Zn-dependent protease
MASLREELIQEALAADPNDPLVHFAAGGFYLEERRYEDAVAAFRTATELKPDYSAAWLGLARSIAGAGDDDAARAAYEEAIRVAAQNRDLKVRNEARTELEQLDEF